jgi:hypothetical protein
MTLLASMPWQVFPSHHSILLKSEAPIAAVPRSNPSSENTAAFQFFLQTNDRSTAESLEPPLSLTLCEDEIRELRDSRLAAAAHYGPAAQEKASNEDFALSAVIRTEGGEFAFAAVADGVSTRTFWSARAARIACIGTYKAVRECLLSGMDPADESKHLDIAERVAAFVDQAFTDDCLALTESQSIPNGWDRTIYEKHNGNVSAWYRSTLLFGLIGKNGGVIGITGDGGVRGLLIENGKAREPVELRVMFSEAGKDLSSFVSRGFSKTDIQLLPLRSRERQATHVIFSSDGLDLTLQRYAPNEVEDSGRRCRSRYRDLPLDNAQTAFDFLQMLSQDSQTVPDNLSVARLTWPLPNEKKKWARWKIEKFKRWKLADPDNAKAKPDELNSAPSIKSEARSTATPPRWLVAALAGAIIGSIVTFASVAGVVGFGKLKSELLSSKAAQVLRRAIPERAPEPSDFPAFNDTRHLRATDTMNPPINE